MADNLIQLVLQMRDSGYTNDQIIQELQTQGYESTEIYNAMSQSTTQTGAPITPEEGILPGEQYDISQPPAESMQMASIRDEIESVAESIIEEKWAEFEDSVKKILDWKAEVESKIEIFSKNVDDLKANMMNLQKGIFGKINEYDKSIVNVGTDIKSLEKVFKDVLPTFTENVQELSRLSKKLKK